MAIRILLMTGDLADAEMKKRVILTT